MIASLLGDTYGYATGLISGGNTLTPVVAKIFSDGATQGFIGGILLWFGVNSDSRCFITRLESEVDVQVVMELAVSLI